MNELFILSVWPSTKYQYRSVDAGGRGLGVLAVSDTLHSSLSCTVKLINQLSTSSLDD